MPDAKLETAEELFALFSDAEKLKGYAYMQPIVSTSGINNEEFHMDLPYEEIKELVEKERDLFLSHVPEAERGTLRWEHVGSTSIKGMPGTKFPDALLITPSFPPSRGVIQAFLDAGFYFSRASPLNSRDLWFFHPFTDGVCKDHKLTVHVVTEDNPAGKILLETRDRCRSEEWAFNDYKEAKIASYQKASGSFMNYKIGKGQSKLLQELKAKYSS